MQLFHPTSPAKDPSSKKPLLARNLLYNVVMPNYQDKSKQKDTRFLANNCLYFLTSLALLYLGISEDHVFLTIAVIVIQPARD